MRDYKFRGQRQSDNKWIYGDLLQPTELFDGYEISDCESIDRSRYDVIKHTIGQYTGFKDKNEVEIFEGDIVFSDSEDDCGYVEWDKDMCCFLIVFSGLCINFDHFLSRELKVCGNLYDNSELLDWINVNY